jgi:hypothetical protein
MIRRIPAIVVFIVLLGCYILSVTQLNRERTAFIEDEFLEYTIPSALLKPLSLEFKGLVSDMLLIKFMSFVGGKTDQLNEFQDEDWQGIRHTLETITDLDPYYWDAYLFAQVFLTWDKKHYTDANELLEKAWKYITDDYRIPYYIGLNYYNFAKDSKNGAEYIKAASRIEGAPFYLANLAARLYAYSSDYQRGIIFLKEMAKQTTDPEILNQYRLRINALQRMETLEKAITIFHDNFDRFPEDLEELVKNGILAEIPEEPYGGEYYIKEDGEIATTSKMVGEYHK